MRPLNPYIAGNPITGEQGFFGREDVLRQVERIFSAPGQNAVVIFGQRRIGKTSVLLQLQRRLDPQRFVVVYQDLMDKATKPMGEVMGELARSVALEVGLPEPKLKFDDDGLNFQREFLPQVYAKLPSPDHHLVFLFDEFDVLDVVQRERLGANAAANWLFETLRRWIREEGRLEFAFALGRDPKDLDNTDFLATFKGAQITRISVLDREATAQLITAPSGSIYYTEAAIERIFGLTNGHPYFTQLLCQLAFDRAYASPDANVPLVAETDIDAIVPQVFQVGDNVFAWIWDGLSPADRIITSALAELLADGAAAASREAVIDALPAGRIRTITPRELEASPEKLVEWQLLQRADDGYRFLVPLLHRWIRERKPLSLVQDELDRVNPRAQYLYELGRFSENDKNLLEALDFYERALRVNPEHLQARLRVAEIYLELNRLDEAVQAYEEAYRRDDAQSRSGLVRALLARAGKAADEEKALADYERVVAVMPGNEIAKEKRLSIWKARAVRAFGAMQYAEALDAFDKAGDAEGRSKAEAALRLAVTYEKGESALKQGQAVEAVEYFRQVVALDPYYEDVAKELAESINKIRVAKLSYREEEWRDTRSTGLEDKLPPKKPEPRKMERMELFRVATFYAWLLAAILGAYLLYTAPVLPPVLNWEIYTCNESGNGANVVAGTVIGILFGLAGFPMMRFVQVREDRNILQSLGLAVVMFIGIVALLFFGIALITKIRFEFGVLCYNHPAVLISSSFVAMIIVNGLRLLFKSSPIP